MLIRKHAARRVARACFCKSGQARRRRHRGVVLARRPTLFRSSIYRYVEAYPGRVDSVTGACASPRPHRESTPIGVDSRSPRPQEPHAITATQNAGSAPPTTF